MDEKLKVIREKILSYYGLDIEEAKCYFSTQNYAFIFKEKPYMIRVSIGSSKSRQETLSEILWVDDLKQFSDTICEPSPSLNDHLIEEFDIDGISYRTAMFRTARGKVKDIAKMDPMYFIAVGDLLGTIHAASSDANRQGIRYKRPVWEDKRDGLINAVRDKMDPAMLARIEKEYEQIKAVPRDDDSFGMIHGDFHPNNFFAEGNNIWVFDFDDCCYGYYMNDIATVLISWLVFGYKVPESRRKVLYEDILPYFRIGYELHMKYDEEYWSLLEQFMRFRQSGLALALTKMSLNGGLTEEIDRIKNLTYLMLQYDDILEGLDIILQKAASQSAND